MSLFVGDYSKLTWLYFLKVELFLHFSSLYSEIRIRFVRPSHDTLQTNARELLPKPCEHFLPANGILHPSFSSDTFKQNGIAEVKHRHITKLL